MEKVTLKVEGMSCEHCVSAVTNALKVLEGVTSAKVSLDDKQAFVEYDAGKVGLETLRQAIEDQGFDVV